MFKRVAIYLQDAHDLREGLDIARYAEAKGFDGIWQAESRLVRDAIGFSKDRGDSVNLMNTPFNTTEPATPDVPLWKQPEVLDMARSLAWPVGMVLLGLLVLQGFVRPALKQLNQPTRVVPVAGAQIDAIESEAPQRPDLLPAPETQQALPMSIEQVRMEDARNLAKQNPVAVANIIKTWVNGEAPT